LALIENAESISNDGMKGKKREKPLLLKEKGRSKGRGVFQVRKVPL